MKKVLLVSVLSLFFATAHAQINLKSIEEKAASTATGTEISNLLTGIESNLKSTSESTTFASQKTSWLSSAKKALTAAEGANLLSQLASGLKSSAFSSGWAAIKDKWFASAKSTTTNSGLKSLASQLVSNINPSSFVSSSSKSTIESLLTKLE